MMTILVAALAGVILGSGWAGAVGWSLKLSRPYRVTHNRFMIRIAQAIVLITMFGGLLLLQVFDDRMAIQRHSAAQYAATYAYIVSCASVVFLVLRADYRWQKSVGRDDKTGG